MTKHKYSGLTPELHQRLVGEHASLTGYQSVTLYLVAKTLFNTFSTQAS